MSRAGHAVAYHLNFRSAHAFINQRFVYPPRKFVGVSNGGVVGGSNLCNGTETLDRKIGNKFQESADTDIDLPDDSRISGVRDKYAGAREFIVKSCDINVRKVKAVRYGNTI